MRALKKVRLRLRSLLRGSRVEQELDEELRDHLERDVERRIAAGQPADAARAAARKAFGNVPLIQEQVRDTRRVRWFEDLLRDLAYALRSMRRAPGHTVVAVLSLAAAIGANTAVFTLAHVLLLRDLPVEQPGRLVELSRGEDGTGNFSYPLFERVRDGATAFDSVVAVSSTSIRVGGPGAERPLMGRYVTGNFFDTLGVRPALGRLLSPDDDQVATQGEPVAMIGHGLWQTMYGGRTDVVGQTMVVGGGPPRNAGVPFTIVGVLPRGFDGLTVGRADDFYLPLAAEPRVGPRSLLGSPSAGWLKVVGRLEDGVSLEQAKADADVIYAGYLRERAATAPQPVSPRALEDRLTVVSARAGLAGPRREFGRPVSILMGAVALVLLVACANVINLLLARGLARMTELGTRLAIGASRARLIRQLLAEAAVLGALGGSIGLALAVWGTPRIARLMANEDPTIAYNVRPDNAVLAFTAIVSIGAALIAGLVPALRLSRGALPSVRSRDATGSVAIWSRALIVSQVALSLLLLAGAFLLMATLSNLRTGDFGFEREGVVTMRVEPGFAGLTPPARAVYLRDVLDRVRGVTGVRAAALSLGMPVISSGVDSSFTPEGAERDPEATAFVNEVSDGYFAATGTQLLGGRDFGPQDRPGSPPVAIVNDALVRRYFGGRSPLGQRATVGIRGVVEIVGVVETTKYESLREADSPIVYTHALQGTGLGPGLNLVVKADGGDPMAAEIRRVALAAGPVPVTAVRTLASQIDRTLVRERLIARVLGTLALVAVLLAAAGLYGVLAYTVTRRTREIGVRLALGATRSGVLAPVLQQSLALVALGIGIGVPASLALARLLESTLYGVTPGDPRVLAAVVGSLLGVAFLAGLVPAFRASRVDPLIALRSE